MPHGVLAERPNPLRQHSRSAFCFQAVQVGNLSRRTEQDRVQSLPPRVVSTLPSFAQGVHPVRPIEDVIQVGFELVPLQGRVLRLSFLASEPFGRATTSVV